MDEFPPFTYLPSPRGRFDETMAIIAMLEYLKKLFEEFATHRQDLAPQEAAIGRFAEAKEEAERGVDELIAMMRNRIVRQDPGVNWHDYGFVGPALEFKMQVIAAASQTYSLQRNRVLEGVIDRDRKRETGFWRKAFETLLKAIDGPLGSLTKALGLHEGVVEFKEALEILLGMAKND